MGGWDLINQGTAAATAENRDLRHGFYLTQDATVEFDGDGNPTNATLLGTQASGGPGTTLEAGASSFFPALELTIPGDLTGGEYDLILYVDDYEEVSEFDEVNNKLTTVVPITVVSDLFENGSFDAPEVTADRGWDLFTNGQVPNWNFAWTTCGETCPPEPLLELQTNGLIVAGRDGGQYAELDSDFGSAPGNQANLRLYRDVHTCEGASYTLSYSWAKLLSNDLMTVRWGDGECSPSPTARMPPSTPGTTRLSSSRATAQP